MTTHSAPSTPGECDAAGDGHIVSGGKKYRVVVETGADFSSNVGDEAYFAAMVDLFRERLGDHIDIVKFANEPETVMKRYNIGAIYSGHGLKRRLAALWPTIRAIAAADVYVWGGGQMPLDSHGVLSVLYRFHRPLLAKLLGTPVMGYATGAGPLDMPHSRFIVRHCMKAFDVITVRDHCSVELLREIGVRKPIHETIDSAVVLDPAPAARVEQILRVENVPLDRPLVGVAPWGPAFKKLKSIVPVIFRKKHFSREDKLRFEEHCEIMASALDSFIERHGVSVIFVAMDPSQAHGFDDKVAELTRQKMKHSDRTHLLLGSRYHPKEIKGVFGRCEIVAGSRLHGLIMATGEMVPTVGICFAEKTRDFARLTGQEKTYVDAGNLARSGKLTAALDRCWHEREDRRRKLRGLVGQFKKEARINAERLAGLMGARPHPGTPNSRGKAVVIGTAASADHRCDEASGLNINEVVEQNLCTFCGTCYGVCPRSNITIEREWDDQPRPVVADESQCTGCGLCLQVCPGHKTDFGAAREFVFKRQPRNPLVGCVEKLLLTRSARRDSLHRATSGATVSEIIAHILEQGLVDGVAVTSMDYSARRPRPRTWIAQDPADVALLNGSVYMSAPVNTILQVIRKNKSADRIAMVGLGCHIQGLRAAQQQFAWARERVPLAIGLFCGHGVRPAGTWHILRRLGISPEDVTDLAYRAGPPPGWFKSTTRDGRRREMKMCDYSYALTCYGNSRCSMCVDPLCELADISVGDAWLPEMQRRGGWNLTIARTPAGAEIINELVGKGALLAEETTDERLIQGQRMQLYQRERGAWARMIWRRRMGKAVPAYTGLEAKPLRPSDMRRALTILAAQWIAQLRLTQSLMPWVVQLGGRILSLFPSRSKKDALIGRDEAYSKEFFHGRQY